MRTIFTHYRGLILCISILLISLQLSAQTCPEPTNATITTTAAECRSSGTITVTNVEGNALGTPQISLYNQANTIEIRPWQDADTFNDLMAGTYTVRVRYSCVNGFSTEFSKQAIVTGNYVDPNVSIKVDKVDECTNGQITATASSGVGPYEFALVDSQTATEPVANYIRPRQANGTFSGLAAGTYYVRVYDQCGSYVTGSIVLGKFTQADPFYSFKFTYLACENFEGNLMVSTNQYLPGDTRTLTISFPNGEIITSNFTSGGAKNYTFNADIAKFGPLDNTKTFPDNIINWPVTINMSLQTECGTFTKAYVYQKPVYSLVIKKNASDCMGDQIAAGLSLPTAVDGINLKLGTDAEVKVGSGEWTNIIPNQIQNVTYTQNFLAPFGESTTICVRVCGVEVCQTYTPQNDTPVTVIEETGEKSCAGNSGITFKTSYPYSPSTSPAFPMSVHLISGPAGVTIPDFTYTHALYVFAVPVETQNLPIGTYIFEVKDKCGITQQVQLTLSHPVAEVTASYSYPCGSTNMQINFNPTYYNHGNQSTYTQVYWQLFKADGTSFITVPQSTVTNMAEVTEALENGDYLIKFWRGATPTCVYSKPWTKTSNFINVSNVMINQNCPGATPTSTITATAEFGVEPYRYSLYKDSYAPENLLVASQASNIFEGITGTGPFLVFVEDDCGRGTQATISQNVASLKVNNDAGGVMPCEGESLNLSILALTNATYQWFKDDVAISGATGNTYAVQGIDASDAGTYTVELSLGSCPIQYNAFTLDPNRCDEQLPVNLTRFDLERKIVEGKTAVNVTWETTWETMNEGFEIMRSADLKTWNSLGLVPSRGLNGEQTGLLKYSFLDQMPLNGVGYYQLKQIDTDGKISKSFIRSISSKAELDLVISPNPVQSKFTITSNLSNLESVRIVNPNGTTVFQHKLKVNEKPLISVSYRLHPMWLF